MRTAKESDALEKLKQSLSSDNDLSQPVFDDRRLLNFLRARDLNIPAAEQMFRNHLEWREKNQIDTILTSDVVPVDNPFLAALPVDIIGIDKSGNSVIVVYTETLEIKSLLMKYGKEMAMNVLHYLLETAYAHLVENSPDNNQVLNKVTYIVDMNGIKFKDYVSGDVLEFLIAALKTFESQYPELLTKAVVLNAPFIFPVLWNLLKPFMAPNTIDKVEVLGQNFIKNKTFLMELLGEATLPVRWGGKGHSERIPDLNTTGNETESQSIAVIQPGECFEVPFHVDSPEATLRWQFKTKSHDIGFSVLFKPVGNDDDDGKEKVAYSRITATKSAKSGSLVCDRPGTYICTFDNSYSRFREKTLVYMVGISSSTLNGNREL